MGMREGVVPKASIGGNIRGLMRLLGGNKNTRAQEHKNARVHEHKTHDSERATCNRIECGWWWREQHCIGVFNLIRKALPPSLQT